MSEPVLIAVLAAGSGSRLGGGKLGRECGGKALGRWAHDAVAATGAAAIWIAGPGGEPGFGPPIEPIVNPRAANGLATSLACAAGIAASRQARALIVTLADMPLVTTALLLELIAAEGTSAARYPGGRLGVPARFDACHFTALQALEGDSGGSALLRHLGAAGIDADPAELFDVDTAADLAEAARRLSRR